MNKIKVLNIVVAKVWGGGEQYVYDISRTMREKGIEVFVAVDKSNLELQKRFSEVATVLCFDLYKIAGLSSILDIAAKSGINLSAIDRDSTDIVFCFLEHDQPHYTA